MWVIKLSLKNPFTIEDNGQPTSPANLYNTEVVFADSLKSMPESQWAWPYQDSTYLEIGLAAVGGEDFSADALTASPMVKAYSLSEEKENRFSFGLFSADQSFELAEYTKDG